LCARVAGSEGGATPDRGLMKLRSLESWLAVVWSLCSCASEVARDETPGVGDPSARKSSKAIEPVVSTLALALDGDAQSAPAMVRLDVDGDGRVELTATAELGATRASLIMPFPDSTAPFAGSRFERTGIPSPDEAQLNLDEGEQPNVQFLGAVDGAIVVDHLSEERVRLRLDLMLAPDVSSQSPLVAATGTLEGELTITCWKWADHDSGVGVEVSGGRGGVIELDEALASPHCRATTARLSID
jgi:hypothetical protein